MKKVKCDEEVDKEKHLSAKHECKSCGSFFCTKCAKYTCFECPFCPPPTLTPLTYSPNKKVK